MTGKSCNRMYRARSLRALAVRLAIARAALVLAVLIFGSPAPVASAQEAQPFEPTIHWAYASFFGTGWYKINDQRSGFIMRAPFRWTFGEAGINEDGSREIAWSIRVPATLGLARLDFDDIPGILDPDNLATASANISVDVDIPITERFHVRPVAEVGYSTILNESDWAYTYRAEVKTRTTFQNGRLDWALLFDAGLVGYEANRGDSDDFSFAAVGVEFGYPVNWFSKSGSQTMLYWNTNYTSFIDEIDVRENVDVFDSVASIWQAGIALGRRDERIKIWALSFDRLGLAYSFSTTSNLEGVKFYFRSLYDL